MQNVYKPVSLVIRKYLSLKEYVYKHDVVSWEDGEKQDDKKIVREQRWKGRNNRRKERTEKMVDGCFNKGKGNLNESRRGGGEDEGIDEKRSEDVDQ